MVTRSESIVRRRIRWTALALCAVLLSACPGPWRDRYLDSGVKKVTQEHIVEKFGPPHTAKTPALGGDTVWTYRFPMSDKELHPWNPGNLATGPRTKNAPSASPFAKSLGGADDSYREPLYCYRYTLVFDEAKVLKNWKREDCVPRVDENASTP
jgi:hypothetical protein